MRPRETSKPPSVASLGSKRLQLDRAPTSDGGREPPARFVSTSFIVSAIALLITGDVRRAMTMLLIACPCAVGHHPDRDQRNVSNGAPWHPDQGRIHLEQAGRVGAIIVRQDRDVTVEPRGHQ